MSNTEVVIGWDQVPIYEVRNKDDRYSFTGGPFGSDLKSEHYTDTGVKIIQLQNIGEGKFIDKGLTFTSETKADELSSCNIYPGDIIMAKMAPVARCCKIPKTDDRYVMCSDGIRLSVDKNKFDPEFVFQALNSKYFRDEAESKSTGTTRARIGLNDLKLIPILIPNSKFEQEKIAAILSAVDEKIDLIDQQLAETQALKRGMMQRLLTQGIGHTEFQDSPLGKIPKSWEVVRLSAVCVKIGDGIHSTPKYVENSEYYFVNGNNLTDGKLTIAPKTKCVSKDEYDKLKIDLPFNSILMSINGTIGNIAIYKNEEVIFGKSVAFMSSNDSVLHHLFLYYLLQDAKMKKYFSDELTGSTIKNLSLKSIRNSPIAIPPMIEQKKIAAILSFLDQKLQTQTEKKTAYQTLKTGLMQQLLTGKTRVKLEQTA